MAIHSTQIIYKLNQNVILVQEMPHKAQEYCKNAAKKFNHKHILDRNHADYWYRRTLEEHEIAEDDVNEWDRVAEGNDVNQPLNSGLATTEHPDLPHALQWHREHVRQQKHAAKDNTPARQQNSEWQTVRAEL